MSDVLRLSCSIENESVRNATKDFAHILENLFELYQKFMEKYLKLVKYCEDLNIKCPYDLIELDDHKAKDTATPAKIVQSSKLSTEPTNKSLEQNTETCIPIKKNISIVHSPDLVFESNETLLSNSNIEHEDENVFNKSPILATRCSTVRKSDITPNRSTGSENILRDTSRTSLREDSPIWKEKLQEDKIDASKHVEEDNNNDVIENTPVPKDTKKLGVSKLYHVDTTLLHTGKKLKQSKLVLLPREQSTDIRTSKKNSNLQSLVLPVSPLSTKSPNKRETVQKLCENKGTDEEIIESSPRSAERRLKMKNRLKLKRTSPKKLMKKLSTNEEARASNKSNCVASWDNQRSTPLKEINVTSLSQFSPPRFTSTQKDKPQFIRKSRTVCGLSSDRDISNGNDMSKCSRSPELADIGTSLNYNGDLVPLELDNKETLTGAENNRSTQKRKFSEILGPSLALEDETFFSFVENNKKPNSFSIHDSDFEDDITILKTKSASPPAKRSLMTSFDIVPSKKENKLNLKSGKSRAERAKMEGIACWECEEYYKNLGLSEKEIKARQNQCSRHKTKYKERHFTPEGFWDPMFPDTQSSTLQND